MEKEVSMPAACHPRHRGVYFRILVYLSLYMFPFAAAIALQTRNFLESVPDLPRLRGGV